jgi:hypothetical protein
MTPINLANGITTNTLSAKLGSTMTTFSVTVLTEIPTTVSPNLRLHTLTDAMVPNLTFPDTTRIANLTLLTTTRHGNHIAIARILAVIVPQLTLTQPTPLDCQG